MRTPILLLVVVLSASACGGPGRSGSSAGSDGSPGPDGSGSAASPAAGGAERTTPGDGSPAPGTTAVPGAASPRPTAPPEVIFPPQGDRYVYDVSGVRRTPSMSAVAPYPPGSEWVWDFDKFVPQPGAGIEFHYDTELEADDAEIEIHFDFRRAGLHLAFTRVEQPGTTYACLYEPDIAIVKVPLETGTYPEQSWSGTACSGTTGVRVVGRRTTRDADGTEHRTWEIRESTAYRMQLAEGSVTAKRFYSPDLGVDVRIERSETGTVAGKPYRYDQVMLLAEEQRSGGG